MTLDKSAARIRQMFGQIARRYDLLNHLLSLGIDRRWRRRTAELVAAGEGAQWILDVCTGTADLALAYAQAGRPDVRIVGSDFCRPMLAVAQGKSRRAGGTVPIFGQRREASARKWDCPLWFTQKSGRSRAGAAAHIALVQADTLQLPFPDGRFDIVCVAFGLRNLSDSDGGLREMVRVCRPGGQVAVLEFSTPRSRPLAAVYDWYFRRVLPRVGQTLAQNRQEAYNYLPASVSQFPQGEAMLARMQTAGLEKVCCRAFTLGICTLYTGRRAGPVGLRGDAS